MNWAHGRIHWNELNTRAPQEALAFYAKTLNWTFDEMPMPDGSVYHIAKSGDVMVGGVFDISGPEFDEAPDAWIVYFAVDDVDAAAQALKADGGSALRPPFDVPGVGRILMAKDAVGAVIGLMTPAG